MLLLRNVSTYKPWEDFQYLNYVICFEEDELNCLNFTSNTKLAFPFATHSQSLSPLILQLNLTPDTAKFFNFSK